MQATMVNAFFNFLPCELDVKSAVLFLKFPDLKEDVQISQITRAFLQRSPEHESRMILTTALGEEYAFILDESEPGVDGAAFIYGLVSNQDTVEIRAVQKAGG